MADKLSVRAEKEANFSFVSQAYSLRKAAKVKATELELLEEEMSRNGTANILKC